MGSSKLKLRPLVPEDGVPFKGAIAAFKKEVSPFEFAFDESIPFIEYVRKLEGWTLGRDLPDKSVPSTFLVGIFENLANEPELRVPKRRYWIDIIEIQSWKK